MTALFPLKYFPGDFYNYASIYISPLDNFTSLFFKGKFIVRKVHPDQRIDKICPTNHGRQLCTSDCLLKIKLHSSSYQKKNNIPIGDKHF